jgi:hypothetical protein
LHSIPNGRAREIARCFYSKFKPADGISAGSVYLDGIPSNVRRAPGAAGIAPGHVAVWIAHDSRVRLLARSLDLNQRRVPRTFRKSLQSRLQAHHTSGYRPGSVGTAGQAGAHGVGGMKRPRVWCRLWHWMFWFSLPSEYWGKGGAGSAYCAKCGDRWELDR